MSFVKAAAELAKKYGTRMKREGRNLDGNLSRSSTLYRAGKGSGKKILNDSGLAESAGKLTGLKSTEAEARLFRRLDKKLAAIKKEMTSIKSSDKGLIKKKQAAIDKIESSMKALENGKTARKVASGLAAGGVYTAMED